MPSNMSKLKSPLLSTTSGWSSRAWNILFIDVSPFFKARVACFGGSPWFHHKFPFVCLRCSSETFVQVTDLNSCSCEHSDHCCQRLARSARTSSSRPQMHCRQRLASAPNTLRRDMRSSGLICWYAIAALPTARESGGRGAAGGSQALALTASPRS